MKQEKLSGWLSAVKRLARPLAIAGVVGIAIAGVGVTPAHANTYVGLVTSAHSLHVQHPASRTVQVVTNPGGLRVEVTTTSREQTYRKSEAIVNGVRQYSYVCRDITATETRVVSGAINAMSVLNIDRAIDRAQAEVVADYPTTRNARTQYNPSTNAWSNTVDYAGTCSNNVDVWNGDGRALWGTPALRDTLAGQGEAIAAGVMTLFLIAVMAGVAGGAVTGSVVYLIAGCAAGAVSGLAYGALQGGLGSKGNRWTYSIGGCVTGVIATGLALQAPAAAAWGEKVGLALRAGAARTAASISAAIGQLPVPWTTMLMNDGFGAVELSVLSAT